MKKVTIIIPVYNEEAFVAKTITEVSNSNTLNFRKEIIIVNDGSTDKTKSEINLAIKKNHLKKPDITLRAINKKTNEGKGASVKTGILESSGDIVLIQDADLEYSPDDYPNLLEPFIKFSADVVYGSRFISHKPHRVLYFWHYQVNLFLTTFSNILTNLNLTDMETGYKAFKGDLIREIGQNLCSKRFGFEPEITAKIAKIKGIKIYEVGISYSGRTYGEGKKIVWLDGFRAVWEIIKFNLFSV